MCLSPSVNAAHIDIEEVGKLNISRAKAAKLFGLDHIFRFVVGWAANSLFGFWLWRWLRENSARR